MKIEGIELRRMAEGDRPYGVLSAYEVVRDGSPIGVVAKMRTTSYRKAGRLIAQTFHPLRWAPGTRGDVSILDARFYSRADAVEELLRRRMWGGS